VSKVNKDSRVFLTLGCILRNEGKYVAEWITHHHLVGFERFVCVLHKCTDDTEEQLIRVKDTLHVDIRIHHCETEDVKVQMGTYKWIHEQYGNFTEWLLFLDGDEYVYHVNPSINYQDDIGHLLRGFRDTVSAVACHSRVFGSNGHLVCPKNRLMAYTQRLPLMSIACQAIKTFIRASKMIKVLSPHFQQVSGSVVRFIGEPFAVLDGWRSRDLAVHYPVCFNHYYTGSLEDWLNRYKRGSCNDSRPNQAYSMDEFMFHSQDTEYDDTIQRYQCWHKTLLDKLQ
jgi:hypothetical protein